MLTLPLHHYFNLIKNNLEDSLKGNKLHLDGEKPLTWYRRLLSLCIQYLSLIHI